MRRAILLVVFALLHTPRTDAHDAALLDRIRYTAECQKSLICTAAANIVTGEYTEERTPAKQPLTAKEIGQVNEGIEHLLEIRRLVRVQREWAAVRAAGNRVPDRIDMSPNLPRYKKKEQTIPEDDDETSGDLCEICLSLFAKVDCRDMCKDLEQEPQKRRGYLERDEL